MSNTPVNDFTDSHCILMTQCGYLSICDYATQINTVVINLKHSMVPSDHRLESNLIVVTTADEDLNCSQSASTIMYVF